MTTALGSWNAGEKCSVSSLASFCFQLVYHWLRAVGGRDWNTASLQWRNSRNCPHMGSQCFLAILLPLYCCSSGFTYDMDVISVTSDITPSWQSFQFFGILSTRRANLKFPKCTWFFFFNICVPLNLAFPSMVYELTALALPGGSLECKVSLYSLLNQDLHFNKIHG